MLLIIVGGELGGRKPGVEGEPGQEPGIVG